MKTEFMVAITQLSAEKNLPREVVLAAIESALVSAYKKDAFASSQDISAKINPNTGEVKVYVNKAVVETPADPFHEISFPDAQEIDRNARIGDVVSIEATPRNAGRVAAQTARQVILQRLHEAEHRVIYEQFSCREGDVITGVVQRITPEQINIDIGKAEAILPNSEQAPKERYRTGQRLKLYLLEVARTSRGPRILVSRSHRNLLRRLFEMEIPEIYSGTVEVKSVAREAGYRSKVAVAARQDGIDPVGCCVGLRGIRIQNIVNELNGEKIDVVEWASDPTVFITNALSPAQVASVELSEAESTAVVAVLDKQLSLAIGKEGQNARLAARLTGWRIDIKSTSAVEAEKLSASREAVVEAGETAIEEETTIEFEELVPELVTLVETPDSEPVSEVEAVAVEVAEIPADYEFVLDSEIPSPAQSTEAPLIRFAEDILTSRSVKPKKKTSGKKDAELREGGIKPKKARAKRVSYSEEDELEDRLEVAYAPAGETEPGEQLETANSSVEEGELEE